MGGVRGGGGHMVGGVGREAELGVRVAPGEIGRGYRARGGDWAGWNRRTKGGVRKCRGGGYRSGCGASGVEPSKYGRGR